MRARIDTVTHTRIDMGVILVYIQCEGCYPRIYPDKYEHMLARIDTVSYNRFDMAVILQVVLKREKEDKQQKKESGRYS